MVASQGFRARRSTPAGQTHQHTKTNSDPASLSPLTEAKRKRAIRACGDLLAGTRSRLRYILCWLYWAFRHRSTKHAAWVCEYEGIKWHA